MNPLRWGFVFVACPVSLTEAQRVALVKGAARAWFEDLPEALVDEEELRAWVKPASEAAVFGSFAGQRFTAEVHTTEGRKGNVEFLVAEAMLRSGTVGEA